jgi:hypothetical protein
MRIFLRTVLLILIIALAVLFFVLNPNEHVIFPRCPFNVLTGFYCPGCGSQRAIHSLLHLNFAGVAGNNFLFLPAVLLVFYHYAFPFLNSFFGWKLPNILYLKITPWIIFVVIILFWFFRNLPHFPFSVLAPD